MVRALTDMPPCAQPAIIVCSLPFSYVFVYASRDGVRHRVPSSSLPDAKQKVT